MTHLSKRKLDKSLEGKLQDNLVLIFSGIVKQSDMNSFINSLLTRTEKLMLAKRLAVIILLKEGISETDISRSLNITRSTVDKLRLLSESKGAGYSIAIEILKREKKYEDIKNALVKIIGYSIRAAGGYVKPSIV